jgi:ADP-ribosylglycohydrolase/protein-tyrosine phosphatase
MASPNPGSVLLGLAAGDMLGAPTEFLSRAQVAEQYGAIVGPVKRSFGNFEAGQFTDGTEMALCLLEAYPADPGLLSRARAALGEWQKRGPRSIGVLTEASLVTDPVSAWRASGGSGCGNGALVRAAASVAAGRRGERLLAEAAQLGALTHVDPRSLLGSVCLVAGLERLLAGETYARAWRAALETALESPVTEWLFEGELVDPQVAAELAALLPQAHEELSSAIEHALAGRAGGNSGYAITTLQTAIARGSAASFAEGILPIVNEGGDSDSVAAVCGAILGARELLPPLDWLSDLRAAATFGSWPTAARGDAAVAALERACRRASGVFSPPGGRELRVQRFQPHLLYGRNILTRREAAYLASVGVTHLLDLRGEPEADEMRARMGGDRIHWPEHSIEREGIPIRDGGAPTAGVLERAHEFLERARSQGGIAYVHCRAGVERTGAVLLGWWLRSGGEEAEFYRLCASVRPLPEQVDAVLAWAFGE